MCPDWKGEYTNLAADLSDLLRRKATFLKGDLSSPVS